MYYLVISHMDAQIGRILEALQATGQAERTMVVFTSDQGVAIGSHGLRGKQIHYPKIGRFQLFDLSTDPGELDNIWATRPATAIVSSPR